MINDLQKHIYKQQGATIGLEIYFLGLAYEQFSYEHLYVTSVSICMSFKHKIKFSLYSNNRI